MMQIVDKVMPGKIEVEAVEKEDYRLYKLVIERLAKIIPELGYAIANCKDLEANEFEMSSFRLQDAMTDIATVFAETVQGLECIKPK